jgi:hypothetical protein
MMMMKIIITVTLLIILITLTVHYKENSTVKFGVTAVLLTNIREVLSSNPGKDTAILTEVFVDPFQYLE